MKRTGKLAYVWKLPRVACILDHLAEQRIDPRNNHLDGYLIVPPSWNNYVGPPLRRLYKLDVHWTNGAFVLGENVFDRPAALLDIATDSPEKTHITICIDKDLNVHQICKCGFCKHKDTIYNDDRAGVMWMVASCRVWRL